MSIFRNGHVALSNLRVKGPVIVCHHPAIGEGKLPVEGQFQVISHPIKSFQGVVIRPVEAGDTISFFDLDI